MKKYLVYIYKTNSYNCYDVTRKKTKMLFVHSTNKPIKYDGKDGDKYFKLRKDIIESVV